LVGEEDAEDAKKMKSTQPQPIAVGESEERRNKRKREEDDIKTCPVCLKTASDVQWKARSRFCLACARDVEAAEKDAKAGGALLLQLLLFSACVWC